MPRRPLRLPSSVPTVSTSLAPVATDTPDITLTKARAFVRLIGQIQRRFEKIGKPLIEPHGLTGTQYLVLLRVHDRPDLVQGELSELLDLDANTISDVVRRLQRRGLITRTDHKADRRAYTLRLTREGRQRVARVRHQIDRISLHVYRSLPAGCEDLIAGWLQTTAAIERIPTAGARNLVTKPRNAKGGKRASR